MKEIENDEIIISKYTTIWIPKVLLEKLEKKKLVSQEPYYSVIERILNDE